MKLAGLLVAAGALWLCTCVAAWAADPVVVRTTFKPEQNVVIGQRVRLLVDVLFPGDMPYPPRVALPSVSGAQVFRFESQATTITDQIDGIAYTGQRFEFALYPRRGGELAIPAITATLLDRAQNETGAVSGSPARLVVTVPSGIDASQPVIAATQVTMTEQAGAPPREFHVGDAWRRTIERRAEDVPGLAMAAFDFTVPAGMRRYADPPQIDDKSDRGSLTGERIDQVTYVFGTSGTFVIPALTQTWWDLDAKTVRTITLPARTFHVAAAAAEPAPDRNVWDLAVTGVAIAVLAGLGLGVRPVYARYAAWRRQHELSEAAVFRRLIRICAAGEAGPTYQAYARWSTVLSTHREAKARLTDALQRSGAATLLARLSASLFAAQAAERGWGRTDGRQLARGLRLARLAILRRQRVPRQWLPPLNPKTSGPRVSKA